jgi:membrane-associated phospholipid phosphatase
VLIGGPRTRALSRVRGANRPRWWGEAAIAAAGYAVYSLVRNRQGKETSPTDYQRAFINAQHVIHIEQISGLYHEQRIQTLFLSSTWLVRSFDSFWALAHFLVTAAVVVWLIRWHPDRYRPLRTALALATALGLVCFALFPTLPPRLLPDSYGFVDTWVRVGGIGAKHPPRIERISDPFAAMPSLHVAWAVWCAAAVVPAMKRRWTKAAAIAYPVLTVVAVVVTGNHFVLDTIAGLFLGLVALIVARRLGRQGRQAQPVDRLSPHAEFGSALALSAAGGAPAA